mmetsp:Transcript_4438/g.7558  ORF Transcript_4438/g.7558 Transcript_4438/m.7558 type:complete len:311 (+) Transcript_4438:493-1425(+)
MHTTENTMHSCLIELEKNIFNFEGLSLSEEDYLAESERKNYSVAFNICEHSQRRCSDKQTLDFANSVNENGTCQHLSGSDLAHQQVSLQDQSYPEYGVVMKFKMGNACTDKKDFSLQLQINCDPAASRTHYYLDEESIAQDECEPKVVMSSQHACPIIAMPAFWRWVESNAYFVGGLLVLVGALLLQYGGKHYMASIFIISSFGQACVVLSLIFGLLMPESTPQFMVWGIVIAALLIGSGLGYGAYHWPKAGISLIGLFSGGIIGTLLYTIFFSKFGNQSLQHSYQQLQEANGGEAPAVNSTANDLSASD